MIVVAMAKVADAVRSAGMPALVGRVKTSKIVQAVLYKQFSNDDKPRLSAATRDTDGCTSRPDIETIDT